jgi:hypothetical protein
MDEAVPGHLHGALALDTVTKIAASPSFVPAKAGTQGDKTQTETSGTWVPAFAGTNGIRLTYFS